MRRRMNWGWLLVLPLLAIVAYIAIADPRGVKDVKVPPTVHKETQGREEVFQTEPTNERPGELPFVPSEPVTAYVSTEGDDGASGDREHPFRTISKAVDSGAETIFVFAGTYRESINVSRPGGKLEIVAKPLSDTQKDVVIDLGTALTMSEDATTGLLKAVHMSKAGDFIRKVFVEKTEDLVYDSKLGNYGFDFEAYACNLWRGNEKLVPVMTVEECQSKAGTWTYDGTFVYVNGEQGEYTLSDGAAEHGICLGYLSEVKLTGITVQYARKNGVYLKGCSDGQISRCYFGYSGLNNGLALESSSAMVRDCEAAFNRTDGFNIHGVSTADFIGCISHDNGDDGLSHHDQSGGMVIGGSYYRNVKAGIASPTFGSRNDIVGTFVYENGTGIYAVSSKDGVYPMCTVSGCLIRDNGIGIKTQRYVLDCWNNVFTGNGKNTEEQFGGQIRIYP